MDDVTSDFIFFTIVDARLLGTAVIQTVVVILTTIKPCL